MNQLNKSKYSCIKTNYAYFPDCKKYSYRLETSLMDILKTLIIFASIKQNSIVLSKAMVLKDSVSLVRVAHASIVSVSKSI